MALYFVYVLAQLRSFNLKIKGLMTNQNLGILTKILTPVVMWLSLLMEAKLMYM